MSMHTIDLEPEEGEIISDVDESRAENDDEWEDEGDWEDVTVVEDKKEEPKPKSPQMASESDKAKQVDHESDSDSDDSVIEITDLRKAEVIEIDSSSSESENEVCEDDDDKIKERLGEWLQKFDGNDEDQKFLKSLIKKVENDKLAKKVPEPRDNTLRRNPFYRPQPKKIAKILPNTEESKRKKRSRSRSSSSSSSSDSVSEKKKRRSSIEEIKSSPLKILPCTVIGIPPAEPVKPASTNPEVFQVLNGVEDDLMGLIYGGDGSMDCPASPTKEADKKPISLFDVFKLPKLVNHEVLKTNESESDNDSDIEEGPQSPESRSRSPLQKSVSSESEEDQEEEEEEEESDDEKEEGKEESERSSDSEASEDERTLDKSNPLLNYSKTDCPASPDQVVTPSFDYMRESTASPPPPSRRSPSPPVMPSKPKPKLSFKIQPKKPVQKPTKIDLPEDLLGKEPLWKRRISSFTPNMLKKPSVFDENDSSSGSSNSPDQEEVNKDPRLNQPPKAPKTVWPPKSNSPPQPVPPVLVNRDPRLSQKATTQSSIYGRREANEMVHAPPILPNYYVPNVAPVSSIYAPIIPAAAAAASKPSQNNLHAYNHLPNTQVPIIPTPPQPQQPVTYGSYKAEREKLQNLANNVSGTWSPHEEELYRQQLQKVQTHEQQYQTMLKEIESQKRRSSSEDERSGRSRTNFGAGRVRSKFHTNRPNPPILSSPDSMKVDEYF